MPFQAYNTSPAAAPSVPTNGITFAPEVANQDTHSSLLQKFGSIGKSLVDPIKGGIQNVGKIASGVGQVAKDTFNTAKTQFKQDALQNSQPGSNGMAGFSSGFQTGGNIAKTIMSPISQTVGTAANDVADQASNIKGVQDFANSKVGNALSSAANIPGDKYAAWAQQHPEASKNLEALGNIAQLGTAIGPGKDVLETVGDKVKSGLETTKNVATGNIDAIKANSAIKVDAAATKDATDLLQPTMNKKLAINTLKQSGTMTKPLLDEAGATIKPAKGLGAEETGLLGNVKAKVTPKIENVAEDVKGLISKNKSPIENISSINKEISRVSDEEVTPALKNNKTVISNSAVSKRLEAIQPTRLIKGDDTLSRTYQQVKELMLEKLSEHANTKEGITSHNLWEARKAFDSDVESQFGDAVYNPEKNSAVKSAVRDMRGEINDIVGEVNPKFKGQIKKLSNMYTARDTLAENNYKLLTGQSNKITQFTKNHPLITKGLKYGVGALGLGEAVKHGLP